MFLQVKIFNSSISRTRLVWRRYEFRFITVSKLNVGLWRRFMSYEKLFDSTYRSVVFRCFHRTTTVGRRRFRFVHILSAWRDYRRPDARPEKTFLPFSKCVFIIVLVLCRRSVKAIEKPQKNLAKSIVLRMLLEHLFRFYS